MSFIHSKTASYEMLAFLFLDVCPKHNACKVENETLTMLSPETINGLRRIIREDYGKEVSPQEATQIAENLTSFWDLLAQIYYEDETLNESNKN